MPNTVVIGSGLTGLTVAHELARQGISVTVLESTDTVGGAIRSIREDGFLFEEGANSFLLNDARVSAVLDRLGLSTRIQTPGGNAQNRYILKAGIPVAAPLSPLGAITTPLFSTGAKLRLLAEPFISKSTDPSESLAAFIRRRLGSEVLDFAVQPFVSGIYAGDPDKLIAKHAFPSLWRADQEHGSIIRARFLSPRDPNKIKRRIVSFPDGLAELPCALAATPGIDLHVNAKLTAMEPEPSGGWQIRWSEPSGEQQVRFDHIVITCPAFALAALPWPAPIPQSPLAAIAKLSYPPVAVTGLGFRREDVAHALDGFGLLIPEVESRNVLGVLFSSSLFPGRAPDGHVAITVFSGGDLHPDRALMSADELIDQAYTTLTPILGIRAAPVWERCRLWRNAIPQADSSMGPALEAMDTIERAYRNLHIAGNFRTGISAPQCVLAGIALADKIASKPTPGVEAHQRLY